VSKYRVTLNEIALKQKHLIAEFPLAKQYEEMGVEFDRGNS
jgi:hypothetical protein